MALKENEQNDTKSQVRDFDEKLEMRCENRTAATSMDLLGSSKLNPLSRLNTEDLMTNHTNMMDHLFQNLSVTSCQGEEVGSERGSRFGVSFN